MIKANVVISPSGVPMLMDFGVSHLLKGSIVESATKAEKGTLRWLAPELLIEGADIHTNDSDVWALGMTYLVREQHFDLSSPRIE